MKNIITPRTLASCTWETGYPIAEIRRAAVWPERIVYALAVLAVALFAWGWM